MIKLGSKVKDKITGFTGTVTGRVEYLTGCNQVLVVPAVGKDGKLGESAWFDEQRCSVVGKSVVKIDNGANPGCDIPAPIR